MAIAPALAAAAFEQVSARDNAYQLFEWHAQRNPDAIAVLESERATSYGELALRADAICRFLRERPTESEAPIGVFMDRRAELLSVLLGIWKAGAAYIPFDANEPPSRAAAMLASCGGRILLGDRPKFEAVLGRGPGDGVACFDVTQIPRPDGGELSLCDPGGHRLAYFLFTSGSTGTPKAVEVEHGNVITLLRSARELLRFEATDRYLASSTIAFDASITELFLPLATGASLVLCDRDILLNPGALAEVVRHFGVTIVQTGPSVWSNILASVPDFPRVRVLITHGEAVEPAFAESLLRYGEEVWNLYGPTETAVWATGHRLSHESAASPSRISAPIGRPLAHIVAMVVDDDGQPVEPGALGELCLGGESVARGYRNRSDLTRERFVNLGGVRVYRTGDLVSRDADGVIHYFGRNDEQMQIRGVRVEPREVEAAILEHPRVTHAAATWFQTPAGARSILAAVVLDQPDGCDGEELHGFLAARLPRPMLPARFLFVAALPITPNGKIDRAALRNAVSDAAVRGQATSMAERELSGTERLVIGIWERILGTTGVRPRDHYFSVGGDSLSASRMMLETEAAFALKLPEKLIYHAPRLEEFAARIDRIRSGLDDPPSANDLVFPLVRAGAGSPLFFSNVDLGLAREGAWTIPCPLYALATWTSRGIARGKSLEHLASQYVAAIRGVQPAGPYRLGGYSLGGLIAFEVAQQFRAAGDDVDWLFLLDPAIPGSSRNTGDPGAVEERFLRALKRRVAALRQRCVDWRDFVIVNQHLKRPNALTRLLLPDDRWRAFKYGVSKIQRRYQARRYEGPAVVVYTDQGFPQAWKSLLDPLTEFHGLDSPHLALFREPARAAWMTWISQRVAAGSTADALSDGAP